MSSEDALPAAPLSDDIIGLHALLSTISARLLAAPPDRLTDSIDSALDDVRRFLRADRCGLVGISDDLWTATLRHVAYAEGVSTISGDLNLSVLFPWSRQRVLIEQQPLPIPRVSDLPPEAAVDRATLEAMAVQSSLSVLVQAGPRLHIVAIHCVREERAWIGDHIPLLRLLGEILVSAIERMEQHVHLCEALDELQRLRERLERENVYLRQEARRGSGPDLIVGRGAAIRRSLALAEQVAVTSANVLILGETGTGKERLATYIHERSRRHDRAMVRVNCSAIPTALMESELFGREKGAYTGAHSKQVGRFELANGSTLFLDEIGDLPLEVQVKLLRVLEEHTIERLGNPRPVSVDVRIIAATHQNLLRAVHEGRFRQDLYYRLNVFPITMPPLRERPEDLPLLIQAFVEEFSGALGKRIDEIDPASTKALTTYRWPGNVRELRNVIERAMILATGPRLRIEAPLVEGEPAAPSGLSDVERAHILQVLQDTGWRIRGAHGAASRLGMKPTTLESRIRKLGIVRPGTNPR